MSTVTEMGRGAFGGMSHALVYYTNASLGLSATVELLMVMSKCGVSDTNRTCGVKGTPIRGHNVTLSCIVTYRWMSERAWSRPRAALSASISWDSAAGTFLSKSSTDLTNSLGTTIGETLQGDVTTLGSGTEIPSYDCTTSFHFTAVDDAHYTYAVNDVSWTCVSDPVLTWCMYFKLR